MMILAQTMVPGDWVTTFIVACITAAGGAFAAWKRAGRNNKQKLTMPEPMPEIPVKRVYSPPTFSQHRELERRVTELEAIGIRHREYVEAQLRDIRREQSEQFVKLMTAGEVRKDALMENMSEMVRQFHNRVDQILATQKPNVPS